ncbi:MAG: PEGA domain-containing protein [Candidatus Methanoperedens sp.]|nr:PEGA domain-containing protein [Candidatus Methanoperedens sp.]MCZ7371509.1 PEGA domain-containing protein [Candidatus Methanoperedens sp.]
MVIFKNVMKMQIKTKIVIAIMFYASLAGSVFLSGCVEKSTPGSANFTSWPSGAEIWIDGSNVEEVTPTTISGLKEGNHTYAFRKEGYVVFNGTFYIKSGQTTNVSNGSTRLINETYVIIRGDIIENPPNIRF